MPFPTSSFGRSSTVHSSPASFSPHALNNAAPTQSRNARSMKALAPVCSFALVALCYGVVCIAYYSIEQIIRSPFKNLPLANWKTFPSNLRHLTSKNNVSSPTHRLRSILRQQPVHVRGCGAGCSAGNQFERSFQVSLSVFCHCLLIQRFLHDHWRIGM